MGPAGVSDHASTSKLVLNHSPPTEPHRHDRRVAGNAIPTFGQVRAAPLPAVVLGWSGRFEEVGMSQIPGHHRSLWSTDVEPPAFAPLDGDTTVDVAVVGAGITGLTTALLCKEAGLSVTVVEADRVASGTTLGTTGKVTSQHDLFYASAAEDLGEEIARTYGEANQAAIGIVEELASRHDIDAYASRLPSFVFTRQESQLDAVRQEADVARRLGLPASYTEEVGLPFGVLGAVRFDDQLQVHPVRLVHGFARAVAGDGGSVHERTRVTGVSEEGDLVEVRTELGTVRARHAIIATLLPITDRGFEFAKARPTRAYGIAVELDEEPPEPMYISAESPKRSLRHYHGDGGTFLVVVGESHETGHGEQLTGHYEALIEFARRHFPVRSVAHRWSAQDYMPVDGIPYVGRLSFTDRVQVATGFKKWGLTNGVVAARIMTDAVLGRTHRWAAVFDTHRREPLAKYAELVKENAKVGVRFLADRLSLPGEDRVRELRPGQGTVVRVGGAPVGISRDSDGALHAVDAVCPHMGCVVNWNDAEASWDCPCHGSRFDASGDVLSGPAVRRLRARDRPGST